MRKLTLSLLLAVIWIAASSDAAKDSAMKSTKQPSTSTTAASTSTTTASPTSSSSDSSSTASSTPLPPSTTTPSIMGSLLMDAHSWKKDVVETHPECFEGDQRSPINIDVVETVPAYFEPLRMVNYNATGKVFLNKLAGNFTNSIVGFSAWEDRPYIEGGGLAVRYNLEEVHLSLNEYSALGMGTWMGHSINGAHHTLEIHLIHVREGLSMEQAMQLKGGISIVAVAVRTVFSWYGPHPGVSSPLNRSIFPEAEVADEAYEFVQPEVLIPEDTSAFYRYNGSFAHPPCKPGVIWTVLVEPLTLSLTQFYSYLGHFESNAGASLGHFMDEMPSRGNRIVQLNYGKHRAPVADASVSIRAMFSIPSFLLALILAVVSVSITLLVIYFVRRRDAKRNVGFDNIAMEMPSSF